MDLQPLELSVSDVKQYVYCPRITYFTHLAPVKHRVSHKMEYGREEHLDLDRLEQRRKLVEYGLDQGERRFLDLPGRYSRVLFVGGREAAAAQGTAAQGSGDGHCR